MSATNRGARRTANDFYPTPLSAFEPLIPYLRTHNSIWEPACGDKRLINALIKDGIGADGADLSTGVDFLQDKTDRECIVTNPPFSIAKEFADHAISRADHVYMLLRLNFLGSRKRKEWWKANEPGALFVLSERPDFTGGGGDACDYAWFYWGSLWTGIKHL